LVKTGGEEDSGADLDEAIQGRAGEGKTRPAPGCVTTSRTGIASLAQYANTPTICPPQMEMGDGILEDDLRSDLHYEIYLGIYWALEPMGCGSLQGSGSLV
jgi:hypothetical protein